MRIINNFIHDACKHILTDFNSGNVYFIEFGMVKVNIIGLTCFYFMVIKYMINKKIS